MYKEKWAEFIVYIENGGYWDGGCPMMQVTMGCSGDAGIINLGQKVFRKNRQTVDSASTYHTISVESANAISSRITTKDNDLGDFFSYTFAGVPLFAEFTYDDYLDACDLELEASWSRFDLLDDYDDAKIAALTAYASMQ